MARGAPRDDLRRLLRSVVSAQGLELEDVEVTPAGRRRVVRVVVDGDDGVSLDAVASLSQAVSAALDAPEGERVLGSQPYVLEVSSRGVDRPLTELRHWRRARGRLVAVALTDGSELTGRVEEAGPDGLRVDADGPFRELTWAQVRSGTVQVEFSRPRGDGDGDGDGTEE